MLGLNGGIRLWYIEGINNMRYGKYRLFCEMEALEMESKVQTFLSDMERSDYEAQIWDLKETNERLLEMVKTLQLTIESLHASNKRNEELVKNLLKQVSDLQKMIADLEDRNRLHNKNTYGKKSHKAKKSTTVRTVFTIDNLPAERAICPVTVSRKNSLHYSSEEGLQVKS